MPSSNRCSLTSVDSTVCTHINILLLSGLGGYQNGTPLMRGFPCDYKSTLFNQVVVA
jgi:hypothetical protein